MGSDTMSKKVYELCKDYCEAWEEIRKRDGEPMCQFPIAIALKQLEEQLLDELLPFGGLECFKSASKMKNTLEKIVETANETLKEVSSHE